MVDDATLDQAIDAYFECERADFPAQRSPSEGTRSIEQGEKFRQILAAEGAQIVPRILVVLAAKLKRYREAVDSERDPLELVQGNPVDLFCVNCEHLLFDIGPSSNGYLLDLVQNGNSDVRALATMLLRQHATQVEAQVLQEIAFKDNDELVRSAAAATVLSTPYTSDMETRYRLIGVLDELARRFNPDAATNLTQAFQIGGMDSKQVAAAYCAMSRRYIPRAIARG